MNGDSWRPISKLLSGVSPSVLQSRARRGEKREKKAVGSISVALPFGLEAQSWLSEVTMRTSSVACKYSFARRVRRFVGSGSGGTRVKRELSNNADVPNARTGYCWTSLTTKGNDEGRRTKDESDDEV